jgi:hypothetical protein
VAHETQPRFKQPAGKGWAKLHQSLGYRSPQKIYEEGLWICGRSASLPPLPEQARKAGKCSPSPTYSQAPQPTN